MGRDFAIFRTLGKHHPIRTEQHDSRWLNGEWRHPNIKEKHIVVDNKMLQVMSVSDFKQMTVFVLVLQKFQQIKPPEQYDR